MTRRLPLLIPLALLACLASAAAAAADTSRAEDGRSGPSAVSRVLRALGLEAAPGARGDKAYRRGDYESALRHYGRALEERAGRDPDREGALLDRHTGNALYRQGRYPEAIDRYERSLKSAAAAGIDSGFPADTYRNLGNAWYRKAGTADSTDAREAVADMREAVAHYRKSLRIDPGDRDVKRNLELANAALERLLERQRDQERRRQSGQPPEPPEPSARAKEALARALQLARERRYPEAAKVLDGILRDDPSAASFAAHRQRLDDVMKIGRGEAPADPAPNDPRARPGAGRLP